MLRNHRHAELIDESKLEIADLLQGACSLLRLRLQKCAYYPVENQPHCDGVTYLTGTSLGFNNEQHRNQTKEFRLQHVLYLQQTGHATFMHSQVK